MTSSSTTFATRCPRIIISLPDLTLLALINSNELGELKKSLVLSARTISVSRVILVLLANVATFTSSGIKSLDVTVSPTLIPLMLSKV